MESAETKTIEITVNGRPQRVAEGLTLTNLLVALAIEGSRVAVELNREIVRQPEWDRTPIAEGAKVEIVWFVGGGAR
jgi:thiamine biosynthesis protein ThiS